MAKSGINDFINLITTLGFILIFILPFLRKKKKPSTEQQGDEQHYQEQEDRTEWQVDEVLKTVFAPEPIATPYEETKQSTNQLPARHHAQVESPIKIQDSPIEYKPTLMAPIKKAHPWLASKQDLRRAIIMKEILDPPKGMH